MGRWSIAWLPLLACACVGPGEGEGEGEGEGDPPFCPAPLRCFEVVDQTIDGFAADPANFEGEWDRIGMYVSSFEPLRDKPLRVKRLEIELLDGLDSTDALNATEVSDEVHFPDPGTMRVLELEALRSLQTISVGLTVDQPLEVVSLPNLQQLGSLGLAVHPALCDIDVGHLGAAHPVCEELRIALDEGRYCAAGTATLLGCD